jgi:hypothetical protein
MALLLKKYVFVFFIWVIASFLILALCSLAFDYRIHKNIYIYDILLGGLVFVLIISTVHYRRIKSIGLNTPTKESLSLKQSIEFNSKLSETDAVKKLKFFYKEKLNKISENTYEVKKFNLYGWYRIIIIINDTTSTNAINVSIQSSPILRTTISDFSESYIEVNKLKKMLKR